MNRMCPSEFKFNWGICLFFSTRIFMGVQIFQLKRIKRIREEIKKRRRPSVSSVRQPETCDTAESACPLSVSLSAVLPQRRSRHTSAYSSFLSSLLQLFVCVSDNLLRNSPKSSVNFIFFFSNFYFVIGFFPSPGFW
jgi:hypothetical protein